MPRPTRSYGRPGTVVIPEGWSVGHAAVVATTLLSRVQVGLLGEAQWSEANHRDEQALQDPAYDGPAEIMLVTDSSRAVTPGDERVEVRRYEVKLLAAADGLSTEMVVQVVECDDVDLVEKRLTVDAIERGTQRFSRVLQATLPH